MMMCGFNESGARDLVRISTMDSQDGRYHPPQAAAQLDPDGRLSATALQYYNAEPTTEFQARLEQAFPRPIVLLVGCGIWSISYFFDPSIGGFRVYVNPWNVFAFLLTPLIGLIIAHPMRKATITRDVALKKKAYFSLVAVFILLFIVTLADPKIQNAKVCYITIIGIIFILSSFPILQRSRKMGITWDWTGKPKSTNDMYIQNMGTPLLYWGLLLFWIGTNCAYMADLNQTYLPLWTNISRSWCVFIAGLALIVPAQLALDLAFDQGSQVVAISETFSLYKLDGTFFTNMLASVTCVPPRTVATLLETPIWWSIGWTLMAFCCFLPMDWASLTVQQFCTMTICLLMAPQYAIFVLPAFWKADLVSFSKAGFFYYTFMILWAVAIGINGGIALLLSILGVFLVLIGHRFDLYERKRGISWLNEGEVKLDLTQFGLDVTTLTPQVYGIGQPLYAVGWFFLCMAMSIPM